MKYAVARMQHGRPRLFTGRYRDTRFGPSLPVTAGAPERAKTYDDRVVAQALADTFNVLDFIRLRTGRQPALAWVAMPLPEAHV